MQIVHRISIASSSAIRKELAAIGIVVGARGLATFEIDESYDTWPQVENWIRVRHPVDIISTKFTKQEVSNARWLELVPDWHHGYPQPSKDDFGYEEATYDLSAYCPQCGIGLIQKAPFQMKSEPKWGRNSILQLNWIFDEFFVTPEVWVKAFGSHGILSRPVLSSKGAQLKTVVQLVIEQEIDIVTDGLSLEKCAHCHRVKYLPVTRGLFPAPATIPKGHMAKTRQDFGSGASARKRVIVSRMLASALRNERVRGVSFRPVAKQ